jgi:hypothetical protein
MTNESHVVTGEVLKEKRKSSNLDSPIFRHVIQTITNTYNQAKQTYPSKIYKGLLLHLEYKAEKKVEDCSNASAPTGPPKMATSRSWLTGQYAIVFAL